MLVLMVVIVMVLVRLLLLQTGAFHSLADFTPQLLQFLNVFLDQIRCLLLVLLHRLHGLVEGEGAAAVPVHLSNVANRMRTMF